MQAERAAVEDGGRRAGARHCAEGEASASKEGVGASAEGAGRRTRQEGRRGGGRAAGLRRHRARAGRQERRVAPRARQDARVRARGQRPAARVRVRAHRLPGDDPAAGPQPAAAAAADAQDGAAGQARVQLQRRGARQGGGGVERGPAEVAPARDLHRPHPSAPGRRLHHAPQAGVPE